MEIGERRRAGEVRVEMEVGVQAVAVRLISFRTGVRGGQGGTVCQGVETLALEVRRGRVRDHRGHHQEHHGKTDDQDGHAAALLMIPAPLLSHR
jgi:hypothetical protein